MATLLALQPYLQLALAYLAWGALSGTYLTVYDRKLPHSDDEWAAAFAKSPKLAALNSLVKTLGWNLPGALRALRVFFGGPLPEPLRTIALSPGGAKVIAISAGKALGGEIASAVKQDPPDGAA